MQTFASTMCGKFCGMQSLFESKKRWPLPPFVLVVLE